MQEVLRKIKMRFSYLRYCFQKKPKVLSFENTIKEVTERGKSLVRFGDGELSAIVDSEYDFIYQKNSLTLQNRLKSVFSDTSNERLLLCLPSPLTFKGRKPLIRRYRRIWASYCAQRYSKIQKHLDFKYAYGETQVTRFYMDFEDKSSEVISPKVSLLKTIWDNKRILIIEGKATGLGVGNDLFCNAAVIKRLVCPSEDAFERYAGILEQAAEIGSSVDLILLALGPTATILAYDLSTRFGFHTVDIGHVDIEYMWYLEKADKKVIIPGKWSAEAKLGDHQDIVYPSTDEVIYLKK